MGTVERFTGALSLGLWGQLTLDFPSKINQEDKLKKSFDYTLPGNSETDKGQSLTVFSSESSLIVPKDTTNQNIEQHFIDEFIVKSKKSSPNGIEKTCGSKVYINAGIG